MLRQRKNEAVAGLLLERVRRPDGLRRPWLWTASQPRKGSCRPCFHGRGRERVGVEEVKYSSWKSPGILCLLREDASLMGFRVDPRPWRDVRSAATTCTLRPYALISSVNSAQVVVQQAVHFAHPLRVPTRQPTPVEMLLPPAGVSLPVVSLPVVKTLQDCAEFSRTVSPYVPQLRALPWQVLESISGFDDFKTLYVSTNPLVSSFALSLFLAPIFLVVSEANKNYSQVDRLWSILPSLYNAHYVLWAHMVGLPTQRLNCLLGFSLIWSVSCAPSTAGYGS